MQFTLIVLLCVASCVAYGLVHDQFTARICVEYFTIGHPRYDFLGDDPTKLGIYWGIVATWWVGVLVGVPLASFARLGKLPRLTAAQLVRPLLILMGSTAVLATLAGIVGNFAARAGIVILIGRLAERVPQEKHVVFLTDLWIHNASYLGGFVGGILLMGWVWRQRLLAKSSADSTHSHCP